MRRNFTLLLSAVMLFALASCGGKTDTPTDTKSGEHVHTWEEATCVTPRFCTGCGEIEGEPLGHDMLPATVDAPSTCSRCGLTVGAPLTSVSYSLVNGVLTISGTGPMEDCYDDYDQVPWYEHRFEIMQVIFGSGVTTIGSYAFNECLGLSSFTIPLGVTTIGSNAFRKCTNLTSITIPDTVTIIGAYAFQKCEGLTSVIIPVSVTQIDRGAFADCAGLTSIMIPYDVTDIGPGAFDSCTSLKEIIIEGGNLYFTSMDGVLFNGSMTLLHTYPAGRISEEYVIPDGVTRIEDSAFAACSHLVSLTIPDSVEMMYSNIFSDCVSLTDIYYEGTAEEWAALSANITVPENVTVHYEHIA